MVNSVPTAPAPRPAWARRLDRVAVLATRLGGRVIGRPTESLLADLARPHRAPGAPPQPRSAESSVLAGRRAFESGAHAEALFHFGAAIERSPDAAWAWHGRGDALLGLGDAAAALSAYDRAAAIAPQTGLHQGGRALALRALGQHDAEERAWEAALSLDPSLDWLRSGRPPPRIS